MNMNDRIALEIGRALLRALIAEERALAAEAKLAEIETSINEPEPRTT